MKTIAIIPARGGSKRLAAKNILNFGGIPLMAHSILYAKANSSLIDAVYVSTDDALIKQIALQYGAQVIDRPASLSGDFEPTVTALKHALEILDDDQIENVVLLQPTNPLRPVSLLSDCFRVFQKNNCDSLFTVTQSHKKLGKISNDTFLPFNYEIGQRSQDLEPLFFENGLLYISKGSLVLNHTIISEKAFPFEVNHVFATVDIDTQEDFEYAAYLLQKFFDH
jgi:N-acylneuraminate cytidylyltransferase